LSSEEGARELRGVLDAAGFTHGAVAKLIGAAPRVGVLAVPEVYARRLSGDDPLTTLCRLFTAGVTVSDEAAALAFAPLSPSDAERFGLIARSAEGWEPCLRLEFYGDDLIVASDALEGIQDSPDHVLGLGPASRTLAALTARRPAKRALDVGTGGGLQAILAASHTDEVIGIDVNPRTLEFARFNAALNGVSSVEWREGSWFEPVGGERFDLIVANPPYVISPETELTYRDGDLPVDEVSKLVLREAAGHLEEGGLAFVLCNWVHGREEDWREPLEAELAGRECDAVLLRYVQDDPVGYAASWLRLLSENGRHVFAESLDRWVAYFEEHGIELLSWGAAVLRRRSASTNWIRALEIPAGPTPGAGAHVLRMIEGRDLAAGITSDTAVALFEGTRVETASVYENGGRRSEVARLVPQPNVGFGIRVDEGVLRVLEKCDGRVMLRGAAERAGEPVGDELVGAVRRLASLGVLRVA
jgi:methylase of polypeptide subunit release factors